MSPPIPPSAAPPPHLERSRGSFMSRIRSRSVSSTKTPKAPSIHRSRSIKDALAGAEHIDPFAVSPSHSVSPTTPSNGPSEHATRSALPPSSQLQHSLALLDSRLASMESSGMLGQSGSKPGAVVKGSTARAEQLEADDDSEFEDDERPGHQKKSSLSQFQLPAANRNSGFGFGDAGLWDALGFEESKEAPKEILKPVPTWSHLPPTLPYTLPYPTLSTRAASSSTINSLASSTADSHGLIRRPHDSSATASTSTNDRRSPSANILHFPIPPTLSSASLSALLSRTGSVPPSPSVVEHSAGGYFGNGTLPAHDERADDREDLESDSEASDENELLFIEEVRAVHRLREVDAEVGRRGTSSQGGGRRLSTGELGLGISTGDAASSKMVSRVAVTALPGSHERTPSSPPCASAPHNPATRHDSISSLPGGRPQLPLPTPPSSVQHSSSSPSRSHRIPPPPLLQFTQDDTRPPSTSQHGPSYPRLRSQASLPSLRQPSSPPPIHALPARPQPSSPPTLPPSHISSPLIERSAAQPPPRARSKSLAGTAPGSIRPFAATRSLFTSSPPPTPRITSPPPTPPLPSTPKVPRRLSFSLKRQKSEAKLVADGASRNHDAPPPLPSPDEAGGKRKSMLSIFLPHRFHRSGESPPPLPPLSPSSSIRTHTPPPSASRTTFSPSPLASPALSSSKGEQDFTPSTAGFPSTPSSSARSKPRGDYFGNSKFTTTKEIVPTQEPIIVHTAIVLPLVRGNDEETLLAAPSELRPSPMRESDPRSSPRSVLPSPSATLLTPTPSPIPSHSSTPSHVGLTPEQILKRPARTSSVFALQSDSYHPPSLRESPSISSLRKTVSSSTLSPSVRSLASTHEVPLPKAQEVLVESDSVGEFEPLSLGSPPKRDELPLDSYEPGEEVVPWGDGAETDSEEENDSDDAPLGNMEGALKVQKSLRLNEGRKAGGRRQKGRVERAIEKAKLEKAKEEASISRRTLLNRESRELFTGHSMLPQTDDAVMRRSSSVGITRSPSIPLDPAIADSHLTCDSPPPPPIPRQLRAATLEGALRPALGVSIPAYRPQRDKDGSRSPGRSPHPPPSPISTSQRRPTNHSTTSLGSSNGQPSPGPHLSSSIHHSSTLYHSNNAHESVPSPTLHHSTSVHHSTSIHRHPSSHGHAGALGAVDVVHQRVFVVDHATHILVKISPTTHCLEIIEEAKMRGVLEVGKESEGGFALWEICRAPGLERPIREFELMADVIKSWDHDENLLILRRTLLSPVLSMQVRPRLQDRPGEFVQLEVKRGKWSKRFLKVHDGALMVSKSEKFKDATVLCQLTAFDVFFVAPHHTELLKPPKPFVFALKSLLPAVHFEDQFEYCFYVSVKTNEQLQSWVRFVTESRNVFARQREQAFMNSISPTGTHSETMSPLPSPSPILSQPGKVPSLPRSRPPPPNLTSSPPSHHTNERTRSNSLSRSVQSLRPNPQEWNGMSEGERGKWLKKAEKGARAAGQAFLEFGEERGVQRARSGRR